MAAALPYVHVDKLAISKIFDPKLKSKAEAALAKLAAKHLDATRKVSTKAKAKEGFVFGATFEISKETKGTRTDLTAKIAPYLGTWPKKSMFGFGSSTTSFQGVDEKKIEGEVLDLLDAAMKEYVKKAVVEIVKRAK